MKIWIDYLNLNSSLKFYKALKKTRVQAVARIAQQTRWITCSVRRRWTGSRLVPTTRWANSIWPRKKASKQLCTAFSLREKKVFVISEPPFIFNWILFFLNFFFFKVQKFRTLQKHNSQLNSLSNSEYVDQNQLTIKTESDKKIKKK